MEIKSQRGFTLVEILVVIAIVMMLSTLAVNGYVGYRRSVAVDLAGDNLISQFDELKAKTLYGEGDGQRFSVLKAAGESVEAENVQAYCYGVYFEKVDQGFALSRYSVPFDGTQQWREGKWQYVGCADPDNLLDLELDEQVYVAEVEGVEQDFYVVAEPPNGRLSSDLELEELNIVLSSVNSNNNSRTIKINVQ